MELDKWPAKALSRYFAALALAGEEEEFVKALEGCERIWDHPHYMEAPAACAAEALRELGTAKAVSMSSYLCEKGLSMLRPGDLAGMDAAKARNRAKNAMAAAARFAGLALGSEGDSDPAAQIASAAAASRILAQFWDEDFSQELSLPWAWAIFKSDGPGLDAARFELLAQAGSWKPMCGHLFQLNGSDGRSDQAGELRKFKFAQALAPKLLECMGKQADPALRAQAAFDASGLAFGGDWDQEKERKKIFWRLWPKLCRMRPRGSGTGRSFGARRCGNWVETCAIRSR